MIDIIKEDEMYSMKRFDELDKAKLSLEFLARQYKIQNFPDEDLDILWRHFKNKLKSKGD